MDQYYQALIKKVDSNPQKFATILGTAAITVLTTLYVRNMIQQSKKFKVVGIKEIPTPDGEYFYLGHMPHMITLPALKITEWHRKLGPIIRLKIGVQDWVSIGSPEVAHDIFVRQGANTSGRPRITFGTDISGKGGRGIIFADYGKKWNNARAAVLTILSNKSVDGFQEILEWQADITVDQLIQHTKDHGSVNPLPYVRCASINIILSTAFGIENVASPDDPLCKELTYLTEKGVGFAGALGDIGSYFPALSFLDVIFQKEKQMKDYVNNEFHPMFNRLIKQARENGKDCLVNKLDKIKDQYEIDEQNITVIMTEVFVAGNDTVSLSTAWTYAILCNHPEVQAKLARELDEFVEKHGRAPTFNDRLELPYYISVQKECLRYRPASFLSVSRKATVDVVYKDYIIPEGTTIVSNIHTMQTDSDVYPEPEKFKPERFINDPRTMHASGNGSIKERDTYVFGWGRRICPGIYLAETELFNTITKTLLRCTIEPAISPTTGEKVYPVLDDFVDGPTVAPVPFQSRFVERVVHNNNTSSA